MSSTPNYGFNLPVPADPMSDVADGYNNAFTVMRSMVQPNKGSVAGSVLPTKTAGPTVGDYAVGDVIHLTGWKSNFILLAYDPFIAGTYWGYIWRPIEAAWGPWVNSPSTAFDSANYQPSTVNPLRYRVSNTGEIEFAGGIKSFSGGSDVVWPKWSGVDAAFFAPIPVNCRPAVNMNLQLTLIHPDLTLTAKAFQFAYASLSKATGNIFMRVFNSSVANDGFATEVHFNNVLWPMATRNDLVG